jgi:hypothetical protein
MRMTPGGGRFAAAISSGVICRLCGWLGATAVGAVPLTLNG